MWLIRSYFRLIKLKIYVRYFLHIRPNRQTINLMKYLPFLLAIFIFTNCQSQERKTMTEKPNYTVQKTDTEWKNELTDEQYYILRQKGTERPNTGKYNLHFENGTYYCAGCSQKLFESDSKFESHCGWPSFDKAIKDAIVYKEDRTHGMVRTEILCSQCGGHLGHVFNDGPTDTGLRYCVNSGSLDFENGTKE